MKFISTFFLFFALAALLYVNVGDLARIERNIAEAKMEANKNAGSARSVTTIRVSIAEVGSNSIFFTDQKELRYQGKLYDIVSKKQVGSNLFLQLLPDEKEEGLIADLKDNIEQWFKVPQKDGNRKSVCKQPNLLKDFLVSKRFITANLNTVSVPYFGAYAPSLNAPVLLVAKNPPRWVSATT